jgi:putative ABC transport system ATP-binding protein
VRRCGLADIIITKKIKKYYMLGEVLVPVLKGVDLRIKEGGFISIMGASGSGKTTLLNQIGLLDTPTAGEVVINAIKIKKLSLKKRAQFRLRKIGFIFQFFDLLPELTAIENIMLPMQIAGDIEKKKIKQRANNLIELVGLKERMHHKPSQLSGGQMQRVAIARALANDPEIILADDPTAGLDDRMTTQITDLLKDINKKQKKTIIVVTHDKNVASRTERILRLVDGKVFDESEYGLEYVEKKIAEMINSLGKYVKDLKSSKSIDENMIILKNIGRLSNEICFLDLKEEEDIMKEVNKKLSKVMGKAKKIMECDVDRIMHKEEELENKIAKKCNIIQATSYELLKSAVTEKPEEFKSKFNKEIKIIEQHLKLLKELRVKEELLNQKVREKLTKIVHAAHKKSA